jgi:hypothetical protein
MALAHGVVETVKYCEKADCCIYITQCTRVDFHKSLFASGAKGVTMLKYVLGHSYQTAPGSLEMNEALYSALDWGANPLHGA